MGAHLDTVLDRSDYAQVIVRVLPQDAEAVSGRLVALRDQYEARFERLMDELKLPSRADRRSLRLFLLGALNWAQVWYRPGDEAPADIARRFTGYLRRALDGGQRSQ